MDEKDPTQEELKVYVRVRPQQQKDRIWVRAVDEHRLRTTNHRNVEEDLEYEFEIVFGPESSQESIYETCVKPLLHHVLNGKNASVFAYGPTGSGKTHTIVGDKLAPGIIPRCVQDVFSQISTEIANGKRCKFDVFFSYLEIYNEKVNDLLNEKATDLKIRQDSDKQLHVAGLTEKELKSFEEFKQSFSVASKKRVTAATKLNTHSSRSHAVLMLKVIKSDMTKSPAQKLCSKLYLIDLAGSEDNRRTGNEGIRLKESGAINTSLFMLSEVVDALNKGKPLIPYRQSKLTRLLQDSLGGSASSVMIINIAPEEQHCLDTNSALMLARKAKKIVNNVTTNYIIEKSVKVAYFEKSETVIRKRPAETNSCPLSDIDSNVLGSLVNSHKNLASEVHYLHAEIASLKSQNSAGSSQYSGDSVHFFQGDSVNATARVDDVTFDITGVQPKQSTPLKTSSGGALVDFDHMFDSPFILPPKAKKSKACARQSVCMPQMDAQAFGLEQKQDHNNRVLALLNGSLGDLTQLPTIGAKKAQIIYNWRLTNGPLKSIADLQKIDAFGGYNRFCQANIVSL